jgi:Flp pilus assembly pilin Flp
MWFYIKNRRPKTLVLVASRKHVGKGQVLAEYGLLFGLVTVGAIAAIISMRDELITMFGKLTAALAGIGVP